ncbi:MAG: hypothetical protein ABIP88_00930 [Candidatus Binatia bacterium]
MSESGFQSFAAAKGFHPQTLARWLSWPLADRGVLAKLTLDLKIGENQLRDLMDWSEEIALRDGIAIAAIFAGKAIDAIATDPRLGRADKVKRIKESLRRLRFPRLAQAEDEIHGKIRALKLQPEIRVTVAPGLEGGRLQIEFSVTNQQDFKRLAEKLATAAETSFSYEIFSLLGVTAKSPKNA